MGAGGQRGPQAKASFADSWNLDGKGPGEVGIALRLQEEGHDTSRARDLALWGTLVPLGHLPIQGQLEGLSPWALRCKGASYLYLSKSVTWT